MKQKEHDLYFLLGYVKGFLQLEGIKPSGSLKDLFDRYSEVEK